MTPLNSKVTVELIADEELGGFTARVPDIPAYGEGKTEDEAIADLHQALRGYIETFGIAAAMERMTTPTTLRRIDLNFAELVRD